MNEKTIKGICRRIESILSNLKAPLSLGDNSSKTLSYDGKSFAFTDDSVQTYNDLLKSILKLDDFNKKFSEKYLENELKKLFLKVISDKNFDSLFKYVDDLIRNLKTYNKEQYVILPILGISLEKDSFGIGNLKIRKFEKKDTDDLIKQIDFIIDRMKDTAEKKASSKKLQNDILNNNFKNYVCVEMNMIAEPSRASERIIEESRRIIDILYFFIPALYAHNLKVHIGLVGDIFQAKRFSTVFSVDKNSFNVKMDIVGPLSPFIISDTTISQMENLGIFKLSEIICKDDNSINSYEKVLLRGIHWFASAQKQNENENTLLNLITTLETFLTPKDGNTIGTAIAEGTAILLSKGLENRKKMKKRVQELYRLRSAVSHGGRKVIFDSDVRQLMYIVGNLIVVLIENLDNFTNHTDLFDFIESEKLGG